MQAEVLTPVFGIILLVWAYVILIYLKTFLVHLYSSQTTPKKSKIMDNKILFFMVKNGKCVFKLDQNRLSFKICGDIIKYGDDASSKKKIIIHDDFYVKKYLIFLIKNAKRRKR